MIDYKYILDKNLINVLIDILRYIEKNGLPNNYQIYITFDTTNNGVIIPKWLHDKHKEEMTIVLQYEFDNLVVNENSFNLDLSFNNIKTNIEVSFESIIAFSDPVNNFGLKLRRKNKNNYINKNEIEDNIIDFKKYKKD